MSVNMNAALNGKFSRSLHSAFLFIYSLSVDHVDEVECGVNGKKG